MEFYFTNSHSFGSSKSSGISSASNSTSSLTYSISTSADRHEKLAFTLMEVQKETEILKSKVYKSESIEDLIESIDDLQLKATTMLNRNYTTKNLSPVHEKKPVNEPSLLAYPQSVQRIYERKLSPRNPFNIGRTNSIVNKQSYNNDAYFENNSPVAQEKKKVTFFDDSTTENCTKNKGRKGKILKFFRQKKKFLRERKNSFEEILSTLSLLHPFCYEC